MGIVHRYTSLALATFRLSVRRTNRPPQDLDAASLAMIERPYTMTSPERVDALCQTVRYVVANEIPGDMVECGVWRGGSMMAVTSTLVGLGDTRRHVHLFDTFEGMVRPDPIDRFRDGSPARAVFDREIRASADSRRCQASLSDVRANLATTGYPESSIHYVPGKGEDTLPGAAPGQTSMLRLDTDWYESTRHKLESLFPRLVPGEVLHVDDYGFWQGCRRPLEVLRRLDRRPMLTRIDDSGRLAIVRGWPGGSASESRASARRLAIDIRNQD